MNVLIFEAKDFTYNGIVGTIFWSACSWHRIWRDWWCYSGTIKTRWWWNPWCKLEANKMQSRAEPLLKSMSLLLLPLSPETPRVIFKRENTIWSRNSVEYFDAADRDNGERSGDIKNVAKDYESCVIFECDQAHCLAWRKLKSAALKCKE